jgi:hypothetical protein
VTLQPRMNSVMKYASSVGIKYRLVYSKLSRFV